MVRSLIRRVLGRQDVGVSKAPLELPPSDSRERARAMVMGLQDEICAGLEALDGEGRFVEESWVRPEGGGGRSRVMREGRVFEQGGVGKSTVAVNLACALAQTGLRVGLLDADIYGPNAPTMLGVADQTPEVQGSGDQQRIVPIETCGIGMVSMGLLIDDHQPVIWRGPMLNGIIRQFLYQAEWGERDVLIVDLPPGTGDAQLSLAQAVPMAGVVIVTTPQQVSLQDARRGLAMFRQMGIPVLGVVENMSAFIPPDRPDCRYALFGSGGGAQLAADYDVPLLAQIPMEMPVQEGGDTGRPIVITAATPPAPLSSKALLKRCSRPSPSPSDDVQPT